MQEESFDDGAKSINSISIMRLVRISKRNATYKAAINQFMQHK